MNVFRMASLAVLAIGLGGLREAVGDEGRSQGAPHGGTITKAGTRDYEVVFARTGLKVYPLTPDHKPVDASRLTGSATFFHPNAPDKPWFQMPLRAAGTSLDLNVDLGTVPASGAKVAIEVASLPDPTTSKATFTVPFTLPKPATLLYSATTKADETAIAAQRVCKVSGEPLGSMGGPIKVSLGTRSTFLCCKNCLPKVQANPDAYLPAAVTAPTEITVTKTAETDQAAIKAQKVCKVSGEDLFTMGGPLKVSRGDKSTFICCQSCLKTIQADPDKYLVSTVATEVPKAK